MNIFNKIGESFGLLNDNVSKIFEESFPALILIIIGFAAALFIELILRLFLKWVGINRWLEKTSIQRMLNILDVKFQPHRIISMTIFWIVFIIFFGAVADLEGWNSVTHSLKQFISFIPAVFGALLIVIIGRIISNLARKAFEAILSKSGSKSAMLLAKLTYYVLMAITITIAFSYLGINTNILTANLTIILGSLLLSFSLAFAFASRNILKNILSSSYNKSNFAVGQRISIHGNEGEIISITNISVFIKTDEKIQVIPATKFTEEIVEILG